MSDSRRDWGKEIADRLREYSTIQRKYAKTQSENSMKKKSGLKSLRTEIHHLIEESVKRLSQSEREILVYFGFLFDPVPVDILLFLTHGRFSKVELESILNRLCAYSLLHMEMEQKEFPCLYSAHPLTWECIRKYGKSQAPLLLEGFLNVDYLDNSIRRGRIRQVLTALRLIEEHCPNVDLKRLHDYRKFLRTKPEILVIDEDLKQLTLNEPHTSFVYQDMLSKVKDEHFFFEWTNRPQLRPGLEGLLVRFRSPHGISYAVYLSMWNIVVTSSGETITFWSTNTLCRLIEHRVGDTIDSFQITEDGKYLLVLHQQKRAVESATLWQMSLDELSFQLANTYPKRASIANMHGKLELKPRDFGIDSAIRCSAISSDGNLILLGTFHGLLVFYKSEMITVAQKKKIRRCSISPDCDFLLVLVYDQPGAHVYYVSQQPFKVELHSTFEHAKCHPDSAVFRSAGLSHLSVFVSARKATYEYKMARDPNSKDHSLEVAYVAAVTSVFTTWTVSADGKLVAGLDSDQQRIFLWQSHCPTPFKSFHARLSRSGKELLSFSANSKQLFASSCEVEYLIWNIDEIPDTTEKDPVWLGGIWRRVFFRYTCPDAANTVAIDGLGHIYVWQGLEGRIKSTNLTTEHEHCDMNGDYVLFVANNDDDEPKVCLYNHVDNQTVFRDSNGQLMGCRFVSDQPLEFAIVYNEEIHYHRLDSEKKQLIEIGRFELSSLGLLVGEYHSIEHVHFFPNTQWLMLLVYVWQDDQRKSRCLLYNRSLPPGEAVKWDYCNEHAFRPLQGLSFGQVKVGNVFKISVAESSGQLHLIEIHDCKEVKSKNYTFNEGITVCKLGPTSFLYGTSDGQIVKLDHEFKEIKRFAHSKKRRAVRLAYSPDERFIVSADGIKWQSSIVDSIKLWSGNGVLLRTFFPGASVRYLIVEFGTGAPSQDSETEKPDSRQAKLDSAALANITLLAATDDEIFILRKLANSTPKTSILAKCLK